MKITKIENGKMFNTENSIDIYTEDGYNGSIFTKLLPNDITIEELENIFNTQSEKAEGQYNIKDDGLVFFIWKGETSYVAEFDNDMTTETEINNLCNYLNKMEE